MAFRPKGLCIALLTCGKREPHRTSQAATAICILVLRPPRERPSRVYRIRRVFHFRNRAQMFEIVPPLGEFLLLTPTTYLAAPK
jgi:hypothetical protein